QPSANDPSLPSHSEVALVDGHGRVINATDAKAFGALPADWRSRTAKHGAAVWYADGQDGERRVFSAAPAVSDDGFVLFFAQSPGLWAWGGANPPTGTRFP